MSKHMILGYKERSWGLTSKFLLNTSIWFSISIFLYLFFVNFFAQTQRLSYPFCFNLLKKLVLVDISVSEKSTDSDTCSELIA